MGYLNNSSITVDAVLTKRGRELLAQGQDAFKITRFALADDEIDYRLWNPNHTSGSAYYGVAIESMPLVEASIDETQTMKYKLITIPKNSTALPVIEVGATSIVLQRSNVSTIISPSTSPVAFNSLLGYTAILHNSDVAYLYVDTPLEPGVQPTVPYSLSDSEIRKSTTQVGMSFKLVSKYLTTTTNTKLTIIGNETGGYVSIPVTVYADPRGTAGTGDVKSITA